MVIIRAYSAVSILNITVMYKHSMVDMQPRLIYRKSHSMSRLKSWQLSLCFVTTRATAKNRQAAIRLALLVKNSRREAARAEINLAAFYRQARYASCRTQRAIVELRIRHLTTV